MSTFDMNPLWTTLYIPIQYMLALEPHTDTYTATEYCAVVHQINCNVSVLSDGRRGKAQKNISNSKSQGSL